MGSLQEGSFSFGPWGGIGGSRWSFFASRGIGSVRVAVNKVSGEQQAQNRDGKFIKFISFKDAAGFVYGPFGGFGGNIKEQDFFAETVRFGKLRKGFLKHITGTFGNVDGMMGTVITSISVVTTKGTYGPFGTPSGTPFSTFTDKTLVVGFFGRSNSQCLEALGVYLMPRCIDGSISVGPWGGAEGTERSFMLNQHGLNQITIHHTRSNIQALSFRNAASENSTTFGSNDSVDNGTLIEINPSSNCITSVTGTYTPTEGITSLGFVTNDRTYGPFGNASGTSFSIPINDSVIVGFHGRGDHRLEALGYYVKPRYEYGSISVGPWGRTGTRGGEWSFRLNQDGLNEIVIRYTGRNIRQIFFGDAEGVNSTEFHNEDHNAQIRIKPSSNCITSVTGTYTPTEGITSLGFVTNDRTYGPLGNASGTSFSIPINDSVIVGFHGRGHAQLETLGYYVRPRCIDGSISVGPWGGAEGTERSFMLNQHGLNQITIHHTRSNIQALSFRNAASENSTTFGSNDSVDNGTLIEINPSSNCITSVTGTYTPTEGITSLGFVTNDRTYGPFGNASGTSFSIPINDSVIVGFHGRGDHRLEALGYYVKPKPEKKIAMGPWGGKGGLLWEFNSRYGINEVIIQYEYDSAVSAIAFRDADGMHSGVFGDAGGRPYETRTIKVIDIDWPSEYLTSIGGSYGNYRGMKLVTSLSFKTNWNSYGPFGTVYGTSFSSQTNNCVIVGFYGGAGDFLDSIGIFARPFNT